MNTHQNTLWSAPFPPRYLSRQDTVSALLWRVCHVALVNCIIGCWEAPCLHGSQNPYCGTKHPFPYIAHLMDHTQEDTHSHRSYGYISYVLFILFAFSSLSLPLASLQLHAVQHFLSVHRSIWLLPLFLPFPLFALFSLWPFQSNLITYPKVTLLLITL